MMCGCHAYPYTLRNYNIQCNVSHNGSLSWPGDVEVTRDIQQSTACKIKTYIHVIFFILYNLCIRISFVCVNVGKVQQPYQNGVTVTSPVVPLLTYMTCV